MKNYLKALGFCFIYLIATLSVSAETNDETGFAPTWKLLSRQEKQQFISGYLHSAKDLRSVLTITIQYLKKNPDQAIEGLEQLRDLYDYSKMQPDKLAEDVDEFFKDPNHNQAPLTKAVTYARFKAR